MSRSGPTLHPPVLKDQTDVDYAVQAMTSLAAQRTQQALNKISPSPDADIAVPIDSVSKDGNFDSYIHIGFAGGPYPNVKLLVDSGNSTLIVPHFEALSQLPGFNQNYTYDPVKVKEPWGADAYIVSCPIVLPRGSGTYTIKNCRFYACTRLNDNGCYTANFGIGCVRPWSVGDPNNLQSPLSYIPEFDFVQIDYVPIDRMFQPSNKPHIVPGSTLTLRKAKPDGFAGAQISASGRGGSATGPDRRSTHSLFQKIGKRDARRRHVATPRLMRPACVRHGAGTIFPRLNR
jgi:hypothetical protein